MVQAVTDPRGTDHVRVMAEAYSADADYRVARDRLAFSETIAREVIRLRMQLGLSQADLARRVGTPASVISRLERGDHEPSTATLRKIAQATGTRAVITFAGPLRRAKVGTPPVHAARVARRPVPERKVEADVGILEVSSPVSRLA